MDIFIKTMGCKTGNNAVTERMHGRAKAKVVTYYKALLTPNIFYMCISVRFLPNQKNPTYQCKPHMHLAMLREMLLLSATCSIIRPL